MKTILGIVAVAATGLVAFLAWTESRKEKDVMVDNRFYRGAY